MSWSGPLTADEIERLNTLLQQHGWFAGNLTGTGEPRRRQLRIGLWWPGGSQRFRLRGETPDVAPVMELLEAAARRRFEGILQTLPKATAPVGRIEIESSR